MEKRESIKFDFLTNEEILKLAEPKNDIERLILEKALKELGDTVVINKLIIYLGVSKSSIRRAISSRKLVSYKVGRKIFIITKSILNLIEVRE